MKKNISVLLNIHTLRASTFTLGLLISFVVNFLFNAYLGRELSFTDFGVITFIGSMWLIIGVFLNALSLTINHSFILIKARASLEKANTFFRHTQKTVVLVALTGSFVWIISSPLIHNAFDLGSTQTVLFLTPMFLAGALAASNRGYLQAIYKFPQVGILLIVESLVKLLLAIFFVEVHSYTFVYLAIPLSVISAYTLSKILLPIIIVNRNKPETENFPSHFYLASVVTILSTTLLFTCDVILAKFFLDAEVAGQYAFLTLIGKMIYFFGSLLNTIMVPYISNKIGTQKESKKLFSLFALGSSILIGLAFLFVGLFGWVTLPLLFGQKVMAIIQYLLPYAGAMSLLTLANTFVVYNLLHKRYIFPLAALFFTLLMILGIVFFHSGIQEIVNVLIVLSVTSSGVIFLLHFSTSLRNMVESRLSFLTTVYEK